MGSFVVNMLINAALIVIPVPTHDYSKDAAQNQQQVAQQQKDSK